ncbi:hypothetical protein GcM1_241072 [Golovinomyces cichoracearum]|uniref:Uncharacterized protein n=1 Tax=Golovinomyces cichoracearum TaxID=62708 RepID=A0A420IHN9_9PEZI|nr:hypothetical protein GcM1_241072 [Golovinomyces cichoracearum]
MKVFVSLVIYTFTKIVGVSANTEKLLILGPKLDSISRLESLNLDYLDLRSLSPEYGRLRTYIPAEFPTYSSVHGRESWTLLHGLVEGQRYEVRICWAATQPTSFILETFDVIDILTNPKLKSSLARSYETKLPKLNGLTEMREQNYQGLKSIEQFSSMLFLRIFAAADYYTSNSSLMQDVPPVHVDIILDPYSFNICPGSLIPTAAYILILAISGWILSNTVNEWAEVCHKSGLKDQKKQ